MNALILILTWFILFTSTGETRADHSQEVAQKSKGLVSEFHINKTVSNRSLEDMIRAEKDIIEDTLDQFKAFIISNRDALYSNNSENSFNDKKNAFLEWKKFQKFEKGLSGRNSSKENLSRTKQFIKDSLQILIVKLASIRTLEEKSLLNTDIKENPEYYLNLLSELEDSDLDPSVYLYYENKIRTVNQEIISRKYAMSMIINLFALLTLISLIFAFLKWRKNIAAAPDPSLSKQEKIIKLLLLQGKTNKEIADELFISPNTVKTHTSNIYSKLKISGRKDLLQN